jgi:protocatechuate 3,4-dioxygenase beta subunit
VVVSGTVKDEAGKPVAGAQLVAQTTAPGYIDAPCAATDAEGRFRLAGAALGDTLIAVFAPGYRLLEERRDLRADQVLDLRLLTGAGTTLRIHVSGATREQLASARCAFNVTRGGEADAILPPSVREGTPDADGVWQVTGLPRDLQYCFIRVNVPDAVVAPRFLAAPAGKELHELEFQVLATGGSRIHGILVDAAGKPLPGLALRCHNRDRGKPATATTAADGTFTIECPVPVGEAFVLALADQEFAIHQDKADKSEEIYWESEFFGTCTEGAELRVTAIPAAALQGRVLDTDGRPVFGAEVRLLLTIAGQLPLLRLDRAVTDRDGRFAIRQLDARQVRPLQLEVTAPVGTFSLAELKLPAKGMFDLGDLPMQAPAGIAGTVTDVDGKPAPGARVRLCQLEVAGNARDFVVIERVVADRSGRYRFTSLPPGRYRVDVTRDANEPKQLGTVFTLEAGSQHDEALKLAK